VTGPGEPCRLDATGLRCPLPVIRLARLAKDLPAGSSVQVRSTDPAAGPDLAAWCRMRGHRLVEQRPDPEDGAVLVSLVRLGDC
jgi:tRNA 2-thiouridine synthesizing protein A